MKVLVGAFRALGDMVLITPILCLLKDSLACELTVVVDELGYEVLLHNPHIDRLIAIDRDKNRHLSPTERLRRELALILHIRSERFDVAVDLFGGPRSALLSRLSGAPSRYAEDPPRWLLKRFYTHRAAVSREGEHLVIQKLKIIRSLIDLDINQNKLPLELFLTDKEKKWGREILRRSGINMNEPVVGFFPGAGWGHKRWPAERFAKLGDRLAKEVGVRAVLIGGVRDSTACEEVTSGMSSPPFTLIQESIRETMAILNSLDLFVSNDTGPMHIAVALGCPTIALFGPSNPIRYGPWGGKTKIITQHLSCSPCRQQVDTCWQVGRDTQECMKRIEVVEVFQEAKSFIEGIAKGSVKGTVGLQTE